MFERELKIVMFSPTYSNNVVSLVSFLLYVDPCSVCAFWGDLQHSCIGIWEVKWSLKREIEIV